MSFLKEFKEDLSQAVNELVDEKAEEAVAETKVEETAVSEPEVAPAAEEEMVNTIDNEEFTLDVAELDSMLEEVAEEEVAVVEEDTVEVEQATPEVEDDVLPSDEIAEITKGTSITGNIESDGSVNLYGKIVGDI